MKKLAMAFALLGVMAFGAHASVNHGSVGPGHGIVVPGADSNPCNGTLALNFDGTAENGYCWHYHGIVPPYYGSFAECYDLGSVGMCGIELLLTSVAGIPCPPCDLYVWDGSGGIPGNVLCTTFGVDPCPVAVWPNVSTHDFAVSCVATGPIFAGYWVGAFANQTCGYFVAADTDGPGGCPYTDIAPGIGYPTGWNNVSVVWGPTQSIGIGVWLSVPPVPTRDNTWGRIKNLYQ